MDLSTSSTYVRSEPGPSATHAGLCRKRIAYWSHGRYSRYLLGRCSQRRRRSGIRRAVPPTFKQILRTILRITRDVADAEDTLQETLLKAYVHIGRFEGGSAFYSTNRWLVDGLNGLLSLQKAEPLEVR
jgi:hypothetical protein